METLLNNEIVCPICNGVKRVHPVIDGKVDYSRTIPCECSKIELSERKRLSLLKGCSLPPRSENMTIDKYNPSRATSKAYERAKEAIKEPGKQIWITLQGSNGMGKTHLAIAICHAWLNAGVPSKYYFVPVLLDELKKGFGKEGEESNDWKFEQLCQIPLLILDDLGAEKGTTWALERLETIIDTRLMNNLSLIVTTNKSLDELSERIRSRLIRFDRKDIYLMIGEDYGETQWKNK